MMPFSGAYQSLTLPLFTLVINQAEVGIYNEHIEILNDNLNKFSLFLKKMGRKSVFMHSNKGRFELASKIIGLVLVVIGIYQAFDAISLWLSLGDQSDLYRQMGIPNEYLGIAKQFDGAMNIVFKDLAMKLLLYSIFPIILGSYLMMPNNVFCRFTYPEREYQTDPSISSELRVPIQEENYDYKPFSMGGSG